MKKLACRDFGGTCDAEITGDSFEEMGRNSMNHVMEQIQSGDEAHKTAADNMRNASPKDQESMMAGYKRKYEEAPEMN